MPRLVQKLGYAGLIPFIFLAGLTIVWPGNDNVARALDLYAFGIISFLCGAWWPTIDMAQASSWRILLSNVLFLVGFFAFIFAPEAWLLLAAALLWIIFALEQASTLLPAAPPQYRRLRLVLTTVASLSLIAAQLV